ncbi:hypothetical protein [Tahibacter amnicola]|uniref:CARDB domain-containing protein n=1 Tax=Tahibacter amnicola TaxID=2976241 RepID=A0ABY6BQL7_9GAMM|nr:hypothetical protein [Tahibacter amnicola]UXI70062.1 hypothetical protein N4264_10675 [Tahibacter amnicola]
MHARRTCLSVALFVLPAVLFAQSFSPHRNPSPQRPPMAFPQTAQTIAQSNSSAITANNSVSCNAQGLHTANGYYRAFTLSKFPILTQPHFRIQNITYGVELANDGANAGQPVQVNLYKSSSNPPTTASLTLLTSESTTVQDTASGTLVSVPITAPPVLNVSTDILVVEIYTPDGMINSHSFFVGSNNAGEVAPSYIKASDCGVTEITSLAAINFPGMQIVMSVTGDNGVPVGLQSFTID